MTGLAGYTLFKSGDNVVSVM